MKRFWTTATAIAQDSHWRIELDQRPVRTPAREPLLLPTDALAQAVASEWQSCGEQIDTRLMPLTGLANAAIDRVAPDPQTFASSLASFAASDLLCYRAERPDSLIAVQEREWAPLLQWARRRFDVDFVVTQGIVPVDQPPATIARLSHAVSVLAPFPLAGLSPLVTISGSLIAALAVLEQAFTIDKAWSAVSVDENWQLEHWGRDAEAEQALALREADFRAAHRFLELLA